jgi:ferredoxin-type protein NapG
VDREGCLAIQGLRCEVCFNRCPLRGQAITLEKIVNERTQRHAILEPVVHKDACTGCGICEQVCIREEPVIKVGRFIPAPRDGDQFYDLKPTKPS